MKKYIAIIYLLFLNSSLGQDVSSKSRFELLSGVKKSKDVKTQWDTKYSKSDYVFGKTPAKFLRSNFDYIKRGSKVLDMGMGEGRNAVFLARQGYNVTGVDISSVAVKKSRLLAKEFGVRVNAIVASLTKYKIPKESFDAIICFYYVERTLHKKMIEWLKPGGVLIYEAHTTNQLSIKGQEHYSKKYLLDPGELINLFPNMTILKYEEPLHVNEFTSSIILQKKI